MVTKRLQRNWILCGGWEATEEETELKNHMKWPKEVAISRNGVMYDFPIWSESKIRFEISQEMDSRIAEEERRDKDPVNPVIQRIIDCSYCCEVQQSHFSRDLPAIDYEEAVNSKAAIVFKEERMRSM